MTDPLDAKGITRALLREFEETFDPRDKKKRYWHAHVAAQYLSRPTQLDSTARRVVLNAMLDACIAIRDRFSSDSSFRKVVLSIDLPLISESQVIVFLREEYYRQFYTRTDPEQRWEPISGSVLKDHGLVLNEEYRELGFRETRDEPEGVMTGQCWFIELS